MDAGEIRRALYDFFRFNPKDFIVQGSGTGFLVRLAKQSAGAAALLPLQPYEASSGGTAKVGITVGTFGDNAVATTGASVPVIDGTRIDEDPAPLLTLGKDDKLIYLQVDVDVNSQITAVTVLSTTDADPPANDVSTLYVRLAEVAVNPAGTSATIGTPNLRGSQTYEQCAGVQHNYWLS